MTPKMAKKKARKKKTVETLTHDADKRKNIPTAEYQPVVSKEQASPIRVAYERRNRDLDPQLVWRGKDEQDWSDLVVHAPPLYIQEKVHPKVLIDDLQRQTKTQEQKGKMQQLDLFGDFNGVPEGDAKTEFYEHDANWTNRMILGDSLQVMASLAEREGLRGKVQCIYIDPPYGIKFNSNFQWSTTNRNVKDGKTDHITREPEQVKAFRDTWRDGIHTYLTYLRDRLTIARDLLSDQGSVFVQIGDENVHRVRALLDEIFGDNNFVSLIPFLKSSSTSSPSGKTDVLSSTADYLLWYAKAIDNVKYRDLYQDKSESKSFDAAYRFERDGRQYRNSDMTAQKPTTVYAFDFEGREYSPLPRGWRTVETGMRRAAFAGRVQRVGNNLAYLQFLDDYPIMPFHNVWSDTVVSGFTANKMYVVETSTKVVERCVLMTTDPGDLVLDPTCGSGTSAYVAEQWGRRWITIDTSRVALALARARIMGARYPYFLLSDSKEGQHKEAEVTRTAPSDAPVHENIRQGFVYERVPHITLKSIANNAEIDVIWEKFQEKLEPLRDQLNKALKQKWEEWEIPREADDDWSAEAKKAHTEWWKQRIARQKEIDASIAAKADFEYLYDKPYEDKSKVRVAGPFTVESLSPHRTLGVDENDELIDPQRHDAQGDAESFGEMILENLKTAGVQQAHKEDRITFTSLVPWPGDMVCAEGHYLEGETQRRAAIFIGPEFGTVQRQDLVQAAREAGDAEFDVLIACAFNFEAHATEFNKLGRIPVLKARMNADLHMAEDLKNTGKGNLFVIFGEPDIGIYEGGSSELKKEVATTEKQIPKLESEISNLDANIKQLKQEQKKLKKADAEKKEQLGKEIESIEEKRANLVRELTRSQEFVDLAPEIPDGQYVVKVYGVDVFKPQLGKVEASSVSKGEIACWFVDTDYNEESFFVRHAYFLGASDPYKSLKTTLKAEINEEAWQSLDSDTSRPFEKPASGRIAVKVINHLGDEVMKVFRVGE